MIADGFHYFWLSFCENSLKYSFCLLLGNHLLAVKTLPVILFGSLVPAFRLPPATLKVVPKASYDSDTVPKSGSECTLQYTEVNRLIRAKESRNRNLMGLSEQF